MLLILLTLRWAPMSRPLPPQSAKTLEADVTMEVRKDLYEISIRRTLYEAIPNTAASQPVVKKTYHRKCIHSSYALFNPRNSPP
ncbi:hypothetical protein BD779DRAFT_1565205 [Infundibulicybe gibba]|nr:hypothetical protein BD779DRAFT_1565205 [Infundibulicybe gibba]